MDPLSFLGLSIWSIRPQLVWTHIHNLDRLELLLSQALHKVHFWIVDVPEDGSKPVLVSLLKDFRLPACCVASCRGPLYGPVEDALFNICWERVGEPDTQLLLRIGPHLSHPLVFAERFEMD